MKCDICGKRPNYNHYEVLNYRLCHDCEKEVSDKIVKMQRSRG